MSIDEYAMYHNNCWELTNLQCENCISNKNTTRCNVPSVEKLNNCLWIYQDKIYSTIILFVRVSFACCKIYFYYIYHYKYIFLCSQVYRQVDYIFFNNRVYESMKVMFLIVQFRSSLRTVYTPHVHSL